MRASHVIILLLAGCQDYDLFRRDDAQGGGDDSGGELPGNPDWNWDGECKPFEIEPEKCGLTDLCDFETGGFDPVVDWEIGAGFSSNSLPVVGDLDGDALPEIVGVIQPLFGNGNIIAVHGDGSGTLWTTKSGDYAVGQAPALADLDADGNPEVLAVREYQNSMLGTGEYAIVALSNKGAELWESDHYVGDDFDYGTAIAVSDMDHDGSPEIIAGRVILNQDGTLQGKGKYGRGCYGSVAFGSLTMDESAVPAVADLDLDGTEEVIVGNAMYAPDGTAIWFDPSQDDAMIGVANIDEDPEGEFIAVSYNTYRAQDTDGSVIWGPVTIKNGNILAPPALADVDGDGRPEGVTAGGDELHCFNAEDGSLLWKAKVQDESGATGASFFDFEGDGQIEVVYVDEVRITIYDGKTGKVKFSSDEHASNTMMDYAVIADVDADGHADIIASHVGASAAYSIYRDKNDSWAPARLVWNQHAYTITNVYDDLRIPQDAVQNFTIYNSYHAGVDRLPGESLAEDLEAEIVDSCELDCGDAVLLLAGRVRNKSEKEIPAGLKVALYAWTAEGRTLIATDAVVEAIPSGMTSEHIVFVVDAAVAAGAESIELVADDDGTGGGLIAECSETNNGSHIMGPFCEEE